ncbi:hypothetical protein BH11MYX2_BH11MYX2_20220 [soil metagenome]
MISLSFLFALGLWMPIASHLCRDWGMNSDSYDFISNDSSTPLIVSPNWSLALRMIGVPFLVACVYAFVELRVTTIARRWRPVLAIVTLGVLLGGVNARYSTAHRRNGWDSSWAGASQNVYANFMHVLLIAVVIAFIALAVFVVAQRQAGKARVGTVSRRGVVRVASPDADTAWRTPIGSVEITSWLRPPRTSIGAFTLVTEQGDVPIPAGGSLGGALPLTTTILSTGEGVVVLRDGDEVEVTGLVEEQAGESPFRSASMLVPGPAGIVVRAPGLETRGATVLALWRPSLAYMAIAAAVAITAIAGAGK